MDSEIVETRDQRPDNIIAAGFDTTRRLENFAGTLREGERVLSSPHPPRSGPPSPRGEGLNALDKGQYAPIIERNRQ